MYDFFYRFTGRRSTLLSIIQNFVTDSKHVVELPFKTYPLSVSTGKAKKRLILDLGYVSLHVWKDGLKLRIERFLVLLTKIGYLLEYSSLTLGWLIIVWILTPTSDLHLGFLLGY